MSPQEFSDKLKAHVSTDETDSINQNRWMEQLELLYSKILNWLDVAVEANQLSTSKSYKICDNQTVPTLSVLAPPYNIHFEPVARRSALLGTVSLSHCPQVNIRSGRIIVPLLYTNNDWHMILIDGTCIRLYETTFLDMMLSLLT